MALSSRRPSSDAGTTSSRISGTGRCDCESSGGAASSSRLEEGAIGTTLAPSARSARNPSTDEAISYSAATVPGEMLAGRSRLGGPGRFSRSQRRGRCKSPHPSAGARRCKTGEIAAGRSRYPGCAVLDLFNKLPNWSTAASCALLSLALAAFTYWSLRRSMPHRRGAANEGKRGAGDKHPAPSGRGRLSPGDDERPGPSAFQAPASRSFIACSRSPCRSSASPSSCGSPCSRSACTATQSHFQIAAGIGRAVTWVVGLGWVAVLVSDALGISLAPALTAFGIGSLAVALALQDTLSIFSPACASFSTSRCASATSSVSIRATTATSSRSGGDPRTSARRPTRSSSYQYDALQGDHHQFLLPTPQVASSVRINVSADSDIDRVEEVFSPTRPGGRSTCPVWSGPEAERRTRAGLRRRRRRVHGCFHVESIDNQPGVQHALRKRIAARFKKERIAFSTASVAPGRRA